MKHLFPKAHLPHPHIAEHVAAVVARALHHGLHDQPPRTTPPAADWPEWHWDHEGGEW